jgi:hypothetical protein
VNGSRGSPQRLIPLLVFLLLTISLGREAFEEWGGNAGAATVESFDHARIEQAFREGLSDQQVRGSGKVIRVLADDTRGSQHQRFLLELPSGLTLLVAHNIDLAPRINGLREGDDVQFFGEYEWNDRGGVIHWTHHDPAGRHPDGWLQHQGQRYE